MEWVLLPFPGEGEKACTPETSIATGYVPGVSQNGDEIKCNVMRMLTKLLEHLYTSFVNVSEDSLKRFILTGVELD